MNLNHISWKQKKAQIEMTSYGRDDCRFGNSVGGVLEMRIDIEDSTCFALMPLLSW